MLKDCFPIALLSLLLFSIVRSRLNFNPYWYMINFPNRFKSYHSFANGQCHPENVSNRLPSLHNRGKLGFGADLQTCFFMWARIILTGPDSYSSITHCVISQRDSTIEKGNTL